MKISNKGLVELVGHEGVCLSKYLDSVGVWTVGIGATKTEIPSISSWPLSRTITMQEAFELLGRSIIKYENAVNAALIKEIPQHQFDALVSWCYNVGVGWVKKASVIKLVNQNAAPIELYNALMLYKKPKEIISRRTKEAKLLAYGIYGNNGKALLFPVSSRGYPVYSKGKELNVWEYIEKKADTEPTPVEVIPDDESKPGLLQTVLNWFTGEKRTP